MTENLESRQLPPPDPSKSRRNFIKKCGVICGSALIYLTPTVRSFAGTADHLSGPPPIFNFSLPATFDVSGDVVTMDITLPGQPTVPVDFMTNARYHLTDAGSPLCNIEIVSMSLVSINPAPLAGVGSSCGRLTGAIDLPGVVVGQLNQTTGILTHAPNIQVNITSTGCGPTSESFDWTNAHASKTTSGDRKCTLENSGDIATAAGAHPGTTVSGDMLLGLIPVGAGS